MFLLPELANFTGSARSQRGEPAPARVGGLPGRRCRTLRRADHRQHLQRAADHSEWAVEVFRLAKERGLKTAYISNGNGTPQVIEYLKPWVDLYKVDLKGFNDLNYRKLGGVLQNVLDTIRLLVEKRFWVEIVTLVVPGFNDSDAELTQIAEFLASVSLDLPWHVTAFHQDYKMQDRANTAAGSLLRAAEIGKRAGLRYVYAGNLPGRVGTHESTYCPSCQTLLIERYGYTILKNVLQDGACPTCHTPIPGVWH